MTKGKDFVDPGFITLEVLVETCVVIISVSLSILPCKISKVQYETVVIHNFK